MLAQPHACACWLLALASRPSNVIRIPPRATEREVERVNSQDSVSVGVASRRVRSNLERWPNRRTAAAVFAFVVAAGRSDVRDALMCMGRVRVRGMLLAGADGRGSRRGVGGKTAATALASTKCQTSQTSARCPSDSL